LLLGASLSATFIFLYVVTLKLEGFLVDMKFYLGFSFESEVWGRVQDAFSQINITTPSATDFELGVGVLESVLHAVSDEFWNGAFTIPKGSGVPLTLGRYYGTEREFVLALARYAEICPNITLKKDGLLVSITRFQ
jgi:hypothetical protein